MPAKKHPCYRGKNAETAYEPKARKFKGEAKPISKVSAKVEEKAIAAAKPEAPKVSKVVNKGKGK